MKIEDNVESCPYPMISEKTISQHTFAIFQLPERLKIKVQTSSTVQIANAICKNVLYIFHRCKFV